MVSTTKPIHLTPFPLIIFTLCFFSCLQLSRAIPLPYHPSPSHIHSSSFPLDATTIFNQLLNLTSTSTSNSTTSITDPLHFSYLNHPIYTDPYFLHSTISPHPIIMSRYYRHVPSIQSRWNDGILFSVRAASYHTTPTLHQTPIPITSQASTTTLSPHPHHLLRIQNLDALVVSAFGAHLFESSSTRGGVEAHFASSARFFILLYDNGIDMDYAHFHPGSINITGLRSSE